MKSFSWCSRRRAASCRAGILHEKLFLVQSTQSCTTWSGEGPATAGKPQSAADVEFYLDIDPASGLEMVHIADPKPQRRQPEFLVRDISRCAGPASQVQGGR